MREEREACGDRRLMHMIEKMNLENAPSSGINKTIPQIQPMHERGC